MPFLAPMMLIGAAAVSVPLALHFFYKARYRPHPWAAMRFLRQSIEQTSRRLKFQEWILLALRCLVLLLLALAIARPTFNSFAAGGRGEAIDAVLVFDTSYSMGAQDGESTRFDRAKAAAQTVIDNLPPASTVQVITCGDRATHVGPVTPGNLDQARQLVQGLELSGLAGDVLPGLVEADRALDRGAGSNKEVYVFSDLQKSGWDRQAGAVKAKAAEIKPRAAVILVRCGNPDRPVANVSVTDITFPVSMPHTRPDQPTRIPVTVHLRNAGAVPVKNLSVTLEVDGVKQDKETGEVPEVAPGQTHPVNLTAKLDKAGPVLLTARVDPDALPGDNRLDRLILVRERVRVLVVDGSPDPRDPQSEGSFYVRNALRAVPESLADEYFVKVSVVPAEEAGPALLQQTDVCVLCNVPASGQDRPGVPGLSKAFADRLAQFVKDGGGLVIGGGENVLPARYNAVLGSAGLGLLPFDLDEPTAAPEDKPFKPAPDTAEAPGFLAKYRADPDKSAMAAVEVQKVLGVKEADHTGGRVLMRLIDGRPWLAGRVVGGGEVLFVGTSLDATWGNWVGLGSSSFVPFMQYTLAHMTGKGSQGMNLIAGQPIVYHPAEAPRGFDVVRPDGKRVKVGKAEGGENGRQLTVTYQDTGLGGVYRIGLEGEDPPQGPRYAVAPDLRETDDLTALSDAEVEQTVGFRPVLILAGADSDATLAGERGKREWTIWVLILLLLASAGEMAWAWACGRAW